MIGELMVESALAALSTTFDQDVRLDRAALDTTGGSLLDPQAGLLLCIGVRAHDRRPAAPPAP